MMEHFGIRLQKRKYSFNLVREEFALPDTKPSVRIYRKPADRSIYVDDEGTAYREDWCEKYRKKCLENFDLNMKYFECLNHDDFNKQIREFLKRYNKFCEITNLSNYREKSGFYMMVLDEYKQVYIGKANDIKKRIQRHWSRTMPLDRTLFPPNAVETSRLSIDCFRALDTTRIFVWKEEIINDGVEEELIEDFPTEYLCNRIGGDVSTLLGALLTYKERNLVDKLS